MERDSEQGQGGEAEAPAMAGASVGAAIWVSDPTFVSEFQQCPTGSSELSLKAATFLYVCVTRVI